MNADLAMPVIGVVDAAPFRGPPTEFSQPRLAAAPIGDGGLMSPFEFSTAGLPRKDQFQAWRASYSSAFDLARPGHAGGNFTGRHQVWDLGSLAFARMSTDPMDFAGLAGHGRFDPLDHWLVTLHLSGSSVTVTGDRQLAGEVGSVQLHALGRSFEGSISGSDLLMLFVPRDLCRDMAHVLDAIAFARFAGGMGRILADYMVSLARRLPALDRSELPAVVEATRAMLLACAEPDAERLDEAEDCISSTLLERARRYIHGHLHDHELGPLALSRELGVSRSRLYRLFEESDGVMRYIQRRRLAAAHVALADASDRRRIMEIGESFCFGDGAEFSRAFRREFGYSPSEVRTGARRGLSRRFLEDVDVDASERLNTILRRLQG